MTKAGMTFEPYMRSVSEVNRPILIDLFAEAQKILPSHSLSMKYGFPLLDGYGKFGLAEKSGYVALYFHHDQLSKVVEKHRDKLEKFKLEKESLRYQRASDIPTVEVLAVIRELFGSKP